jgi:hypothetical protein
MSEGRSPRPPSDPTIRIYDWRWGPDEQRRPGLPWIGVFLLVFGGILLVEQTLPEYRRIGDAALLAAGLASLVVWAIRRSTIALYAGAFLTALALPGAIEGLQGGRDLGPGWGTFFFGLAFLFIAAVRAWRGGGFGWQLLYGGVLVLIGGSQIAKPDLAAIAWPILLVVIGAILLIRGSSRT